MVKGPIEGFRDKLAQLEARAGLRPLSKTKGPKPEGKLGPGGRWLLKRLRLPEGHPEKLTTEEEDALGHALAAELDGNLAAAQQLLDMLSEHHRLRLDLERKGLGAEPER